MDIFKQTNNPETEKDFRETLLLYEKYSPSSNQTLNQDCQQDLNNFHKITCIYRIKGDDICSKLIIYGIKGDGISTKLIIYDTESEIKDKRILDTPETLNCVTSITQIPNGELFCYGGNKCSGITLIIDRSYGVRILPPGIPCIQSSCIYFNNNIYCFGGSNDKESLSLSRKFDLNENRWINLTPMPIRDFLCCSAIFKGNILISGFLNKKLLIYSIDLDSYSKIPYKFTSWKRRILINAEKLYLIECRNGLIYESEDEYNWQQISQSIIEYNPPQVCSLYNKGGIYIANSISPYYYKFDLSQKIMTVIQ